MALTVKKWLSQAKTLVNPLDAELILTNVFKAADRTFLVKNEEVVLSDKERQIADRMLGLRTQHVPLAYITGEKWFYGRKFKVTPDVLIPRPETELMVEMAVRLYSLKVKNKLELFDTIIKKKFGSDGLEPSWPDNPNIKREYGLMKKEILAPVLMLEVGVGSGCVAISVALTCQNAEVIGLDIAPEALKVANQNSVRYKVKNLHLRVGDLLSDLKDGVPSPDIIMANLPYVDRAWEWRSPEIEFEPGVALYAEKGGLELIYRLLRQIKAKWPKLFLDKKTHGKFLLLESDQSQHERVIRYAKRYGFKYVATQGLITCFEY